MSGTRGSLLVLIACGVGACATSPARVDQSLSPERGPKASIYATTTGGLLNREAAAVFKVDRPAYVMVAHLGGDGRLEVVYPEDPREGGRVPGGKWYRTSSFLAYYDALPEFYSFAVARYRGVGSRLDSYDGVGYGYIFIIASRYPLRFDRVSGFGLWDDLALDNYRSLIDPRESIRDFARTIAGGNDFTLQFARSGSTASLSSYADQRMDCALLSGFGFSFLPLWSYGFAPLWSANSGYLNNCGYSSAYALGAFGWPWNSYSGGPTFAGAPTNPNNPSSPRSGVPRFSRPGARRPWESGPALSLTRSTINRPAEGPTTAGYAPRDRRPTFGSRVSDAPRTGSRAATSRPTLSRPQSTTREPSRATPAREPARATPSAHSAPASKPSSSQPTGTSGHTSKPIRPDSNQGGGSRR